MTPISWLTRCARFLWTITFLCYAPQSRHSMSRAEAVSAERATDGDKSRRVLSVMGVERSLNLRSRSGSRVVGLWSALARPVR